MKHEDEREMERYLREFQPRVVRALEWERRARHGYGWRLAAAAVVLAALGASLWYTQMHQTKVQKISRSRGVPGNRVPPRELNSLELTRLALTDQEKFNAVLVEQSRRVLPNLKGEHSTLRVLAQ